MAWLGLSRLGGGVVGQGKVLFYAQKETTKCNLAFTARHNFKEGWVSLYSL
jgi:dihydrodipicolinate reductase